MRKWAGSKSRLIETLRHAMVFGEWLRAAVKPTILAHGHDAVQPPGPLDPWATAPIAPTTRWTVVAPSRRHRSIGSISTPNISEVRSPGVGRPTPFMTGPTCAGTCAGRNCASRPEPPQFLTVSENRWHRPEVRHVCLGQRASAEPRHNHGFDDCPFSTRAFAGSGAGPVPVLGRLVIRTVCLVLCPLPEK